MGTNVQFLLFFEMEAYTFVEMNTCMRKFWTVLLSCLMVGCQVTTSEDSFPNLDHIQSLPELKAAEAEVAAILEADPDLDAGLGYGRLAARALAISRLMDAERLYQKAIRIAPDSPFRFDNLNQLASLYRVQLQFDQTAALICCVNQQKADSSSDQESCCPEGFSGPDSLHQILRNRIVADSTGEFSRQAGREYIAFCQSYALLFPDQPKSASYLNEAAKLASSIRMPKVSVALYQWIYSAFPDSEIAPKARFLEGFTLENELKDLEGAKVAYEGYLADYPNDVFAKDAQILLQNLGVDPEELIRRFEQQQ